MSINLRLLIDQINPLEVGDLVLYKDINPGVLLKKDRNYLVKPLTNPVSSLIMAQPHDLTRMLYLPLRYLEVGDVVRYLLYAHQTSGCRDYVVVRFSNGRKPGFVCKNIETGEEQIFRRDSLVLLSLVENQMKITVKEAEVHKGASHDAVFVVPNFID